MTDDDLLERRVRFLTHAAPVSVGMAAAGVRLAVGLLGMAAAVATVTWSAGQPSDEELAVQ